MDIHATVGSKFYVGTAAIAETLQEYEADTWKEVKAIVDLGELGDSAAELTRNFADSGRVRRVKGTKDGGTLELVCSRIPGDEGQAELLTAAAETGHAGQRNFKIVLNDGPPGGSPSEFYFNATVMGSRTRLGGADDIVDITFPLAVNSDVLEVPAAEAEV